MIRKLASAIAITVVALGAMSATAQPAAAATSITSCFKWSTGGVYANQPVNLMQWNGAKWVSIRNGNTNSSGCGTFSNVPSGTYTSMQAYRVYGDKNLGLAIYSSPINNWATAGTGGVNLGLKTVSLVECTWGLYAYCAGN